MFSQQMRFQRSYCPDDCANFDMISNPRGGCPENKIRKRTPSRFAFMSCGIALPSTFTAETTKPLFLGDTTTDPPVAPVIVLSSPLANIVVNDPTTEEVIVHDCMPALQYVNGRIITAEDRIAIEIAAQGQNPANPFFDYDFWKDKKEKSLRLRYGLVYCNGDFVFARDENGVLMEASLQAFISYQKLQNNGGTIEFKKVSLAFQGDPLDFIKPDFNLIDLGINI
jgi:hypothetical protein